MVPSERRILHLTDLAGPLRPRTNRKAYGLKIDRGKPDGADEPADGRESQFGIGRHRFDKNCSV